MKNNSDQKVVYVSSTSYPDTINFTIDGCSVLDINHIAEPGEEKAFIKFGSWNYLIDSLPYKTLMVFVYNVDSAQKIAGLYIGCDSLEKRHDLILKRFDVTVEYLDNNNRRLVYP